MFCESCGGQCEKDSKFCPSCGEKIVPPKPTAGLTLSSVRAHLSEEGDESENGIYSLEVPIGDGDRSQLVFVLPLADEDGDEELDDICIWSRFAGNQEVAPKKLLDINCRGFGFETIGDFRVIQTSIRPWQLRDLEALNWIIYRIAGVADLLEEELLGSDRY